MTGTGCSSVTSPQFLLDTNVCIYVLADAESRPARRLADCEPGCAVASAISYAEVMMGLSRVGPEAIRQAKAFFELIPIVPFDAKAALAYSTLPFRRGSYDRLIGAHALALGLTLVTSNRRDFQDIPHLQIEDWGRA